MRHLFIDKLRTHEKFKHTFSREWRERFEHFFHPGGGHHRGRGGHHGHGKGDDGRGGFGDDDRAIKRLLAHGDLRFVVLLLIEEKPRHGYELIKQIELKSSGQYTPSPGVIYPTLTYLEDTGMVQTNLLDGKKQYSITQEGSQHLDENREVANAILNRLADVGAKLASAKAKASTEPFADEERSEIREVFHAMKAELREFFAASAETKKKILVILKRALTEMQKLKKED